MGAPDKVRNSLILAAAADEKYRLEGKNKEEDGKEVTGCEAATLTGGASCAADSTDSPCRRVALAATDLENCRIDEELMVSVRAATAATTTRFNRTATTLAGNKMQCLFAPAGRIGDSILVGNESLDSSLY